MNEVRLDLFDASTGLDRGRPLYFEIIWYLVKMFFFLTAFPWPNKVKAGLLRMFGARIGYGVVIKPRVNIHFPWKLEIGNHSWIGEEAFILNFEPLIIKSNVCISQRVFLCGGGHDYKDPAFSYRNGPIHINDGVWIGAQSFVAANVTIGKNSVISSGSVVTQDMPNDKVCGGNPCTVIKERW